MGCCGGRKDRLRGYGFVSVRWQGRGMIKVHGGITGKMYRFEGYGSVVAVDDRDKTNILSIPGMIVVG